MFRLNAVDPVPEDSEIEDEDTSGPGMATWTPVAFVFAFISLLYIFSRGKRSNNSSTIKLIFSDGQSGLFISLGHMSLPQYS